MRKSQIAEAGEQKPQEPQKATRRIVYGTPLCPENRYRDEGPVPFPEWLVAKSPRRTCELASLH